MGQITGDPHSSGSPHVRKELVPHKQGVSPVRPHSLHGFQITPSARLSRLEQILGSYLFGKAFHPGLLIVGQQQRGIPQLMQSAKKSHRPLIRRSAVGHQSIVNVKNNASEAFLIQPLIVNIIGAVHLIVRIKSFQHSSFTFLFFSHKTGRNRKGPCLCAAL